MDFGGSWDTYLPLVKFSNNNSYHKSIKCAPFEALYGRTDLTKITKKWLKPHKNEHEIVKSAQKPDDMCLNTHIFDP
nr:putative ribonuclease H-like domain-containing protein [Tanacetum cinerariifolium]